MSSINIGSTSVTFTRDNAQRTQTTGYPTIGTIISWAGKNINKLTSTPYLLCDGSSLNKNSYPDLFTVIEYRYGGSGDNFNLPDFRNRYPAGSDNTNNLSLEGTTGSKGGVYKMSNSHFPHTHNIDSITSGQRSADFKISTWGGSNRQWRSTGENKYDFSKESDNPGHPDNGDVSNTLTATMPPYTILLFIIKVQ